jgi:hypothetical protein
MRKLSKLHKRSVPAEGKRGAMNLEHFRPVQFVYDEASDSIRCPAGETLGLTTNGMSAKPRQTRPQSSVNLNR